MEADGRPMTPPSLASGLAQARGVWDCEEGGHTPLGEDGGDTPIPPQERVVELLFDAFSRRTLTNALWLLDPEIVFEPMTAMVTQDGEPYCGHDGIRRYMQDVEEHWQELTLRPGHVRVAGNAAVVLGTVSGRGIAGSFEDVPTTWILKFRNGRVARAQIFSNSRPLTEALIGDDVPEASLEESS
jgi:ketosteroid isomerase-like protein